MFTLLLACAGAHLDAQRCACDGPPAHGARRCDRGECGECLCLEKVPVDADPEFTTAFDVVPGRPVPWPAIDAALADGPVIVRFGPGRYAERLDVLRTDDGPHRLVLDGGGHGASVPGIHTTYADVRRSRVTVRGFEVTGSDDKGIYWRAGDEVVIEDNVVHDNRGSPALSLEYANRTGLPSSSFVVRNNHVYNQAGECVYIGGSEGENRDAHASLEIVGNLVHNCWDPWDSKHDAINVKDRIGDVLVAGNVVFETHWGIEVASPGLITGNLVFDTQSNGVHLNDAWGTGLSGTVLSETAIWGAGEHGVRVGADRLGADDVVLEGVTIHGSRHGGIVWAGEGGLSARLDRAVLAGNEVALDGWGTVALDVATCHLNANQERDAGALDGVGADCTTGPPGFGDLSHPAGPDGWFFTADDPWRVDGGASP